MINLVDCLFLLYASMLLEKVASAIAVINFFFFFGPPVKLPKCQL